MIEFFLFTAAALVPSWLLFRRRWGRNGGAQATPPVARTGAFRPLGKNPGPQPAALGTRPTGPQTNKAVRGQGFAPLGGPTQPKVDWVTGRPFQD